MKRSGSPAGCGTECVLDLGRRHAELGDECLDVIASPEAFENVAQARGTVRKDRLPEGPSRVDHDLGPLVPGSRINRA